MTKLLFGQSYFLRFDPKLWDSMQPYPPLGTLYACSYMRQRKYEVALFDAMLAESEAEWALALDRETPDYAVIYEDNFNYLSKMCLLRMREAAVTMTQMAKSRGILVIIAGSDATDHAAHYLDSGADYVITGEGELTLAELLETLESGDKEHIRNISGLVHKERDGSPLILPSPRPVMRDLDSLPRPAWDLVDIDKYRQIWLERHGYFSMNMVTTRGCPYHCNWCAKPIWGQRYNVRSPKAVAAEMKWLKDTYAPDHIWFADDIMGLKPNWLAKFADAIEALDAGIPFKSLSRADLLLRGDDLESLKRAGADIIWMGAESGSQKILNAMEKGTTVEQIYEAAHRMRKLGIRSGFFLQFGYPGETRDDIEATFRMIRDLVPDDIGMSVSYPLPGTKFHNTVSEQLVHQQNWVDSNDLAMMYRGPFTTSFYRKLHTVLHKEYRSQKYWDELKTIARSPGRARKHHFRQTAAMIYYRITLPIEHARLNRLARIPHEGFTALPIGMTLEEATTPSPQPD